MSRPPPAVWSGRRDRFLFHQQDSTEHVTLPADQRRAANLAADRLAAAIQAVEGEVGPPRLAGEHRADRLPELLHRQPDVEPLERADPTLAEPETPKFISARTRHEATHYLHVSADTHLQA